MIADAAGTIANSQPKIKRSTSKTPKLTASRCLYLSPITSSNGVYFSSPKTLSEITMEAAGLASAAAELGGFYEWEELESLILSKQTMARRSK